MKKFICSILAIIISLCVIAGVMLYAIRDNAFDSSYHKSLVEMYSDAPRKLGMSTSETEGVIDTVALYIKGDIDDMNVQKADGSFVFNARELIHMKDVRQLFSMGNVVFYTSIAVSLTLFLIIFALSGFYGMGTMFRVYVKVIVFLGLAILGLGIWYYVDFVSFWTAFHKVLFTNDLWLMLPTDALIILYCEEFFTAMVKKIFIEIGIMLLVSIIVSIIGGKLLPKQRGRKFAKQKR